jgi:hypothetical protein
MPAALTAQKDNVMRFLAPAKDDIRIWDRCFKRYPGATATGPLADGALTAAVPIRAANHVKRVWEAARVDDTNPENDSQSDKLQVFKLALKGYKFEASFRGPVKWFAICNVQMLKDDDTLPIVSAETYLDSAVTSSIEEICILLDRMVVQERPFVPTQHNGVSNGAAF